MTVCGIIAEFNPFHNGHLALIDLVRQSGADTVVCVMSGNFVQRGSAAVTDKRVRARAALENGVDIVIELPLASAVSTAQRFARGAVHLLAATGCVDILAFGSEAGDLAGLKILAKAIDEPEVTSIMRNILKDGLTFAKARELAVAKVYGGELASQLAYPNNVLGIEYLRQADLQGLKFEAFTVKRIGAEHHGEGSSGGYASASYLRSNAGDFALLSDNVPPKAAGIYAEAMARGLFPSDAHKLDTAILSHLRRLGMPELSRLPDISEGLENRFYAAIREAKTLAELQNLLKTKRYTMARVRRLILSAFLGLTAKDCDTLPPYIRVLGFTAKGRELLSSVKKRRRLPLDTSLAALRAKGGDLERFASLEEISTDIYGLTLPSPLSCGYEYTESGIFLV